MKLMIMLAAMLVTSPPLAQARPPVTVSESAVATLSGIPLDAPWKTRLYRFARSKLVHPAWGWTHSERDYRLASELAAREALPIDTDILFAAAFTHDIGAIGEYQQDGVDHAVRSIELAEPLLREYGFPVRKLPAVKDAILGHMHDKHPGKGNEAIVLHDADTLDFLGSVGVARRLAVTGDAPTYGDGIGRIRDFAGKLPGRLVTQAAKAMAVARTAEMRRFLSSLEAETVDGRLP